MTDRPKQTHIVKSWAHLFAAFKAGIKTHDMRIMDRDYQVGDYLVLREYDKQTETYTGRVETAEITYITSRDHVPCAFSTSALKGDYAILSIRPLKATIA
jgi:Domain of unknown function (DUF3850)